MYARCLVVACIVSLFMDIYIRRSVNLIHQLGAWAASTRIKVPVVGAEIESFYGWEQFIRKDDGAMQVCP